MEELDGNNSSEARPAVPVPTSIFFTAEVSSEITNNWLFQEDLGLTVKANTELFRAPESIEESSSVVSKIFVTLHSYPGLVAGLSLLILV